MTQKGFAPIIVILIVTLIAVVSLYIYRPIVLDSFVSNFINTSESVSQPVPKETLPTTIPSETSTKIPAIKVSPAIFTPSLTLTPVPTIQFTPSPTPYPTSSATWEDGPPSKKDKPFAGG